MIATSRLLLRPTDPAVDAPEVLTMLLDPDTQLWNPARDVFDLATAKAWCQRQADWSDRTHASFAVIDTESGRYAGSVSIHSVDRVQSDAEIGYRIAPWARGRGFAVEAVTATSAWAFDNLSLVRIELAHAVPNPASCAVATKAGYQLEGVLRRSFVYGDGQRHDEHLHARLRTDG